MLFTIIDDFLFIVNKLKSYVKLIKFRGRHLYVNHLIKLLYLNRLPE